MIYSSMLGVVRWQIRLEHVLATLNTQSNLLVLFPDTLHGVSKKKDMLTIGTPSVVLTPTLV